MKGKQKKPERIVLGVGHPWFYGVRSGGILLSSDPDGQYPVVLAEDRVERDPLYRLVLERVGKR